MKISNKKKYLLIYSAIFIFIAVFFYYFYFSQGKAFVNLLGDGYRQCYRAIIYYQKYLKQIFNNIFVNHTFVIPQWDFTIGEGSDIIQTLNYYVVGDPFAFFCILCPYDKLYLYIDIASFARLYCAGLFFGLLCFYLKKENVIANTIGSLSYVFCFYAIMNTIDFPFMLNYMVFIPLIIYGIEKIINNDGYLLLIVSVFFASMSSLPYFYMTVIFTIIYCIVRAIFINTSLKEKLILSLKISICSIVGVCLASFIFLPSLLGLIKNSRITKEYTNNISIFTLASVKDILPLLIIGDHTTYTYVGGFTIPCLLAIISLVLHGRKNKLAITLIIFSIIFYLSPAFKVFINGMTTQTDRWVGAISLAVAYVFVDNYEKLLDLKKHKLIYLLIAIAYFLISIYLDKARIKIQVLLLCATIATILIISFIKNKTFKELTLLGLSVFCILLNIFNLLSPTLWDYTNKATDISILNKTHDKETMAIDSINDDSFFRYSGNELVCNESSGGDNPSTNFYWSFPNDNIVNFRTDLGYYDYNLNHYDGYNYRSSLLDLASVKYYLVKENEGIPYGFVYYDSSNGYDIYENSNCLSLIYVYENSINYESWKKLNILQRQNVLMNSVVLDDGKDPTNENIQIDDIEYLYEETDGIEVSNNKLIVNNVASSIMLNINYTEPGEYYLLINNLDYLNNGTSTQIYFNGSNGVSNTLFFKTKNHFRYAQRDNFAICLGYLDKPLDSVNISFLDTGEFTYDSIEVCRVDTTVYGKEINDLKDINIKSLNVNTNEVISEVEIDEDKFLCLSIPYANGWEAYVDNEKVELVKANVMYMGFNLEKGNHTIELRYNTPGFVPGIVLSLTALIMIVVYYILKKKNKVKF